MLLDFVNVFFVIFYALINRILFAILQYELGAVFYCSQTIPVLCQAVQDSILVDVISSATCTISGIFVVSHPYPYPYCLWHLCGLICAVYHFTKFVAQPSTGKKQKLAF